MIKSLKIRNFKSINEAEVIFNDFNVIVGLNAAGKTNIISSLSFVRELARGLHTTEVYRKIATLPREVFNRFNTNAEFTVEATVADDENLFRFSIGVSLLNQQKRLPALIITHEKLEKCVDDIYQVVYEREENKLKDAKEKDIPLNVEATQLALPLYVNPDAKRVRKIFTHIRIPSQEIMNARDTIVSSSSPALAGILIKLKRDPETYIQFQEIVSKLLPSFSSVIDTAISNPRLEENSKEVDEYIVLYQEKNIKESLSMQSVSTGDIRTLFLIAVAVSLAPNSTLVIEEIENGIHPKRVADLIHHLNTISRIKKIQLVFTTHSPSVIDCVAPSDVIFVSKDNEEGTKVVTFRETKKMALIQDVLKDGGKLTDYIFSQIG